MQIKDTQTSATHRTRGGVPGNLGAAKNRFAQFVRTRAKKGRHAYVGPEILRHAAGVLCEITAPTETQRHLAECAALSRGLALILMENILAGGDDPGDVAALSRALAAEASALGSLATA